MTSAAQPDPPLDEMVDGAGRIRPAWRRGFEQLQSLGGAVLAERSRLLERAAEEEGAAALLADRDAPSWRCDPVPVILGTDEFAPLVRALAERAALLEAVLDDLYGTQTLLRDGIVPPAMVFGARDFLRPARTGAGPPRRRLSLYAADLVRAPDGAFQVVGDRCARPGGIGRLLENRRLLRRVMPELFRSDVTGLERFFELWRDILHRDGAHARGDPDDAPRQDDPERALKRDRRDEAGAVVLLSEGHRDPAWFEQVLLARELGCDLVQGGDLTLREGHLFVKRLRGLTRVRTVLARQDPHLLDPLELDWTAGAGIPGLLALHRAGKVQMLNDPGAALAEAPGLAAFLPAIGRHLLGRDVTAALPSAETIWLGDPRARARLAAEPDRWTVRSALDARVPPVRIATLGRRGRLRLDAMLPRQGERYAATEQLPPSAAPSMSEDGLVPRPVSFRIFLLHDGTRWVPLPAGFVRVLEADGDPAGVLPRQGLSKDLFIVPSGDGDDGSEAMNWPAAPERLAPRARPVPRRLEGDLPARVAEEFFSLGRELEQLETRARLTRAMATRLERYAGRPRELVDLRILGACLSRTELLPEEALLDPSAPGLAPALAHLASGGGELANEVRRTALRIERLRDRITSEMHGTLSRSMGAVLDEFADSGAGTGLDRLGHVTAAILGFTATLAGLAAETMTRGGSRLFLELGLRLERAETVVTELGAALGPASVLPGPPGARRPGPDLDAALDLLLELRDSTITYRGRYPGRVEPGLVLDLLLADRQNPRALAFQLVEARGLLRALGEVSGVTMLDRVEALIRDVDALVSSVLEADDPEQAAASLPEALVAAEADITAIQRAVARRYIDLLPAAMQTIGG